MRAALPKKLTSKSLQMPHQVPTLHETSSSNGSRTTFSFPTDSSARVRFADSTRSTASLRLARASPNVPLTYLHRVAPRQIRHTRLALSCIPRSVSLFCLARLVRHHITARLTSYLRRWIRRPVPRDPGPAWFPPASATSRRLPSSSCRTGIRPLCTWAWLRSIDRNASD